MQYQYQGKSGGYELSIDQGIAICRFSGVCSDAVAKHYLLDITRLAQANQDKPWAYVVDAIDHLAAIPGAEPFLLEAYQVCKQNSCISDAYCLSNSMAAAQLDKLRKQCDLPGDIQRRSFATINQAIDFVSSELTKLDHTNLASNAALSAG